MHLILPNSLPKHPPPPSPLYPGKLCGEKCDVQVQDGFTLSSNPTAGKGMSSIPLVSPLGDMYVKQSPRTSAEQVGACFMRTHAPNRPLLGACFMRTHAPNQPLLGACFMRMHAPNQPATHTQPHLPSLRLTHAHTHTHTHTTHTQ